MRVAVIWIVTLLTLQVNGQKKPDYSTSYIPEELKDKAVAIVRFNDQELVITDINKATFKVRYAVTILAKPGIPNGIFNEYYDNFRSLGGLKATIYNGDGAVIEKVKSSDIKDFSSAQGFSIYDDTRQKVYIPVVKDLPYTVEYEYEYSYNGIFHLPPWVPVVSYDIAVEKSSFRVITPSGFKIKYLEKNLPSQVKVSDNGKICTYEWSMENQSPCEEEEYSPDPDTFLPLVYIAPVDFEIGGFKGNMETWSDLALWQTTLLKGRDELKEETKEKIRNLVSGFEDDKDKVKAVYNFVQEKTRYVSIQEGIGGWQPMSASEVDQMGYGDCKALSNYAIALLREAGIRSHYVKVNAGRYPTDLKEEFVSNQSNHVFVCVPLKGDTVWLECTSQTSPFGYIGNFTHGRKVLVVTEDGGKIVRSRDYSREENIQATKAVVDIGKDNVCQVETDIIFSGLQYDNISGRIHDSPKENERWLYNNLGINNITVNSFSFSGEKDEPVAYSKYAFTVKGYCSQSGSRLFIPLNMFNKLTRVPPKIKERTREVELNYPYTDIDTIIYIIPENMEVESIPADCSYKTEFGEYLSTVTSDEREITYVRRVSMNKGLFPAESYNTFREFYLNITKADNLKVVLKNSSE